MSLLGRLTASLSGLVERCGWGIATLIFAVGVMVLGLGVVATIEALIGPHQIQLMLVAVVICALAAPCLAIAFKLVEQLGRTHAKLIAEINRRLVAEQQQRQLATTDELTGLSNRRHFLERGREATAIARRYAQWCSFAIIDLDRLKDINDRRGHLAGDNALVTLAAILRANLRASDLAARLGGDEFVVLMPLTQPEAARAGAERILAAVREDSGRPGLSVSIGVASLQGDDATLEALMARADQALYAAKRAGRDRVIPSVVPPSAASRHGEAKLLMVD